MRTSRNSNRSYRILFSFIKFIFFSQMMRETYSVTDDKASTSGSNAMAIPDFFADTLNGIIFNPIVEGVMRKTITAIDGNLKTRISSSDADQTLALCDDAIYEILSENSWIARDQFINDIHTRSLQIILAAPETSYDSSSMGSYSIKHRQIVISYKPGLVKDNYKMALLNELMSHLAVMSNKRCDIATNEYQLMSVPFLKKDGAVDLSLQKKFENTINLGVKRLEQVKVLLEKKTEKLSISEHNLLLQFLVAAKSYTPRTSYASLDSFGGRKKFNEMIAMFFHQDRGYLEPGPNMYGTPFFRGKIVGDYFISHQTHSTRSAVGKLRGFLADFEQSRTSMNVKEGPYAKLASHYKISEFASFIAELPKPLLKLFFPEFSANLKSYLARCRESNVATDVQSNKPARAAFFKPPAHAKELLDERTTPRLA